MASLISQAAEIKSRAEVLSKHLHKRSMSAERANILDDLMKSVYALVDESRVHDINLVRSNEYYATGRELLLTVLDYATSNLEDDICEDGKNTLREACAVFCVEIPGWLTVDVTAIEDALDDFEKVVGDSLNNLLSAIRRVKVDLADTTNMDDVREIVEDLRVEIPDLDNAFGHVAYEADL